MLRVIRTLVMPGCEARSHAMPLLVLASWRGRAVRPFVRCLAVLIFQSIACYLLLQQDG